MVQAGVVKAASAEALRLEAGGQVDCTTVLTVRWRASGAQNER